MCGRDRAANRAIASSVWNICYLTGHETPGYYGYHCLVLAHDRDPVLVLRRFEHANVGEFSWLEDAVLIEDDEVPYAVTIRVLKERGLEKSGALGADRDGRAANQSPK